MLFFFAYYPVIYDLRDSVLGNELARHAPLVIILSTFLIYRKRALLYEKLRKGGNKGPLHLITAGLFLNLFGQASGIYYLSQLSIPLSIYGVAMYIGGKEFSRELIFPLLFLLLAFPIPGKIYMELVFPLKLLVTKTSGVMLQLLGYPVNVFGNIIEIDRTSLGVVDACAGLNSLMAILTLSVFYTHLVVRRGQDRLVIIVSMLPIVMIANTVRVTTTALMVSKWGPEMASGELHWFWGAAVFIMAVFGLLGVTKIFLFIDRRRTGRV